MTEKLNEFFDTEMTTAEWKKIFAAVTILAIIAIVIGATVPAQWWLPEAKRSVKF